jgi:hypothetical protein
MLASSEHAIRKSLTPVRLRMQGLPPKVGAICSSTLQGMVMTNLGAVTQKAGFHLKDAIHVVAFPRLKWKLTSASHGECRQSWKDCKKMVSCVLKLSTHSVLYLLDLETPSEKQRVRWPHLKMVNSGHRIQRSAGMADTNYENPSWI